MIEYAHLKIQKKNLQRRLAGKKNYKREDKNKYLLKKYQKVIDKYLTIKYT